MEPNSNNNQLAVLKDSRGKDVLQDARIQTRQVMVRTDRRTLLAMAQSNVSITN